MLKKSAFQYKSYIAIGSNIGNWKNNFNQALNLLNKIGYVDKISKVYFTKPFGPTNQKYFHNAAILFHTNLFFNELFSKMQFIEKKIKKNKFIKNGPRRIDLDLIQFENLNIKNHLITIPHTSAHLRDFVLKPILDLNPQFIDLNTKKTYKNLLSNLNERFIIKQSRQTQDYRGFF
jgi:2-amino-4-hydroxy-6-hydroxymethyldihydropteridine diphosphokinase